MHCDKKSFLGKYMNTTMSTVNIQNLVFFVAILKRVSSGYFPQKQNCDDDLKIFVQPPKL